MLDFIGDQKRKLIANLKLVVKGKRRIIVTVRRRNLKVVKVNGRVKVQGGNVVE